jgi:hypothetical protein
MPPLPEWSEALAELTTVEMFNQCALALARERRGEFARFVAAEAVRRGYRFHGDRESGYYVDVAPEEYDRTMQELERREHRQCTKRLSQSLRKTRIPQVKAAWEEWVYKGAEDNVGALLILDFRKASSDHLHEFDSVPESLYRKLFEPDAEQVLRQIVTIYKGQNSGEVRDWRNAF